LSINRPWRAWLPTDLSGFQAAAGKPFERVLADFYGLMARDLSVLRACSWIAVCLGCGPQQGGPPQDFTDRDLSIVRGCWWIAVCSGCDPPKGGPRWRPRTKAAGQTFRLIQ